jgi:hypothetical protein
MPRMTEEDIRAKIADGTIFGISIGSMVLKEFRASSPMPGPTMTPGAAAAAGVVPEMQPSGRA